MLLTVLLWLLAAIILAAVAVVGYFVFKTQRIVALVERTMPPAGKFIEVKGNRIHYVDMGEGPPIVFLHGLGAQLHHFTDPLFKVFGPGYRLIALDRPRKDPQAPERFGARITYDLDLTRESPVPVLGFIRASAQAAQ